MNKVSVTSLNKNLNKYEKTVSGILARVLRIINQDNVFLEVYLAGDAKMLFLNKKFRGKNKNANVLSFKEEAGFPHPETKKRCLGEIYLNPEYVMKEPLPSFGRMKPGTKADREFVLGRLVIHGLLHLLGYNHEKKGDRIKMENKEEWLNSKLVN